MIKNIESPTQKPKDKMEDFEKIKSPEELLAFMNDNIKYGFVGKNNKKIYAHDDPDWDKDWVEEYELKSPEDLLDSKYGVCWDSAELERKWFSDKNIKHKVFYAMYTGEGRGDLSTHTFLAYNKDEKWYWFEHSFGDQRGIHEYDSLNELTKDVMKKLHGSSVKRDGATDEDRKRLKYCEYDKPEYGSSPEEFIGRIIDNNKPLSSEKK